MNNKQIRRSTVPKPLESMPKASGSPFGRRTTMTGMSPGVHVDDILGSHNAQLVKDFAVHNKVYHLYLKIYYKCKEGESIGVLGQIPELHNWNPESGCL